MCVWFLLQSVRAVSCSTLRTVTTVLNVAFRSMRPTHWRCSGTMASVFFLLQPLFLFNWAYFFCFHGQFVPPSCLHPSFRRFLFILKEIPGLSFKDGGFNALSSAHFIPFISISRVALLVHLLCSSCSTLFVSPHPSFIHTSQSSYPSVCLLSYLLPVSFSFDICFVL